MSKWLLVIPLCFAVIIGGYVSGANQTEAIQYQIMKQEIIKDNLRLADEIGEQIKKQNEILSKINDLIEQQNETDSENYPKLNPYIDFAEDLGFENEEMNVSAMNFAMYVLSNMEQSYRADVVLGIFLQSAENNGELTIPQVYILDAIMYKDNRQYLCNREGQKFCESFDTIYEKAHSIGLKKDAVDAVSRLWIAKSAGMEAEKDFVEIDYQKTTLEIEKKYG